MQTLHLPYSQKYVYGVSMHESCLDICVMSNDIWSYITFDQCLMKYLMAHWISSIDEMVTIQKNKKIKLLIII